MSEDLRPDLEPLPPRLRHLPVYRGYPVPFFVTWVDGVPEFRAADARRFARALNDRLCWVCGDRLGQYLTFVLGPMCTITRTTAEPALHLTCAEWSARNCPFLVRPHMVRRGHEELIAQDATSRGDAILRNPGVTALWTTKTYTLFKDDRGQVLLSVGEPTRPVAWIAEGRSATRAEVDASIRSGFPLLEATCEKEATDDLRQLAREELARRRDEALVYLPRTRMRVD
jgi:hypothetical protein